MIFSENKKLLLRWYVWFCLGNLVLSWATCYRYFSSIPWVHSVYSVTPILKISAIVFFIFGFVGHLGVLVFLPAVIVVPCIFLFRNKLFVWIISILFALVTTGLLVADSVVFNLYHYHINGVLLNLILHSWKMLGISISEWIYFFGSIGALVLLECSYAFFLWHYFILKNRLNNAEKWLIAVIAMNAFCAYSFIFFCGGEYWRHLLIPVTEVLPLQSAVVDKITEIATGNIVINKITERDVIQPENSGAKLEYPLHALHCDLNKKPMNIVIVAIDAWRADMLNNEVVPNISHFANEAKVFKQHMSGGDCTEPGVFSLFYSLPAAYRSAVNRAQVGPVFIDELLRNHYQIGVFSSATLRYPAFNKNVFRAIKNLMLDTPGKTAYDKDQAITREFQEFISTSVNQEQPFFSFVFYNAAHSYCDFQNDHGVFHPAVKECKRFELTKESDAVPYLNRYKNALLLVDLQVQQLFDTLKKKDLLKNTIVIITGDHGEEFNDNHLGFWGHGSNFTRAQVQTPLIIYWPGEKPAVFTHLTSHYDVVPTLMNRVLGCRGAASDYSLGKDLFDQSARDYLIVNSYLALGVIDKKSITAIQPSGEYQIENLNGQSSETGLDAKIMGQAFADLRRFF